MFTDYCSLITEYCLEWHIAVFFGWILVSFVLQHLQGVDETGAGFAGFDDIIYVAALGSYVGVGEGFAVLRKAVVQRVGIYSINKYSRCRTEEVCTKSSLRRRQAGIFFWQFFLCV